MPTVTIQRTIMSPASTARIQWLVLILHHMQSTNAQLFAIHPLKKELLLFKRRGHQLYWWLFLVWEANCPRQSLVRIGLWGSEDLKLLLWIPGTVRSFISWTTGNKTSIVVGYTALFILIFQFSEIILTYWSTCKTFCVSKTDWHKIRLKNSKRS